MYSKLPSEYTGPFKDILPEYVNFRRSLGYAYGEWAFFMLRTMDLFFKERGVIEVAITQELFEAWMVKSDRESQKNQWRRINTLILFAKYLVSRGYRNIYVGEHERKAPRNDFIPYIFTREEIAAISAVFNRRITGAPGGYTTSAVAILFSLYYSCGLRKSECTKLKISDVNFQTGRLQIIDSKNRKSRIIVTSETMRQQLVKYRNRFRADARDSEFLFHDRNGKAFSSMTLYYHYKSAMLEAGIRPRESGKLPRIHDLRHTFCVHTLESMVAKGVDLYTAFPRLVAYLGHNSISETEYYLRLVDQNFKSVTEKVREYSPAIIPRVGDVYGE